MSDFTQPKNLEQVSHSEFRWEEHSINIRVATLTRSTSSGVLFCYLQHALKNREKLPLWELDDKLWLWQSLNEMQRQMPYFSIDQIREALHILNFKNILMIRPDELPEMDAEITAWYSLENPDWIEAPVIWDNIN